MHWIVVGAIVMIGIGILSGVKARARETPPGNCIERSDSRRRLALLSLLLEAYFGASILTSRMSWLANSIGWLSVSVTSWPVQRSLPLSGPFKPSLARLRWKGWLATRSEPTLRTAIAVAPRRDAGSRPRLPRRRKRECLAAQLVLVDGDNGFVGQDGLDLGLHIGQVVAGQQWRSQHGPHGKVRAIFRQR